MKSKIYIYSLLVVIIAIVYGFTTTDPISKDLSARNSNFNNPMYTYGPSLENPVSTLNESFEGGTFPPAGWTKINPDLGTGWSRLTVGTTPLPGWNGGVVTSPPGGGVGVAFATWTSGGATSNNQWLVSPQLTNSTANDSLSFWLRFWPSNVYSDTVDIKISTTTPTVGGFTTNVATITFPRNSPDTNWTQYKYPIGSLIPAGSNFYIAFRERVNDNLNDGASVSLDLVSVTTSTGPPICNYQWSQQTSGTTSVLYSVSAVSDQVCWAAGVGATVRVTTNGGSTWNNGNAAPGVINGDIFNIYAWSANDALCTTSPAATFIYKTSNGGATWTQVHTLAGGFINAIQMVSATEGYATGDPVGGVWEFLKTTNGGTTWAQVPTAPAQVGGEAGWNNAFYILGSNMWWGTNQTRAYRSTDMGATWTSGVTTGSVNSYAIHYNSPTTGLAGGNAMTLSTNGGANYATITAPGTTGNINSLEGNGSDWWATRTGNTVYRSTNGGTNWTTAYTLTGAAFNDMDFTLSNGCPVGWAVSSAGLIAKMSAVTGITSIGGEVPSAYSLNQNYPNPFNPETNINFSIPKSGLVTLKIYDISGKEVSTLVNEVKNAGSYIVGFNASNLPSGAYFYRIQTDGFADTKKMMLIK